MPRLAGRLGLAPGSNVTLEPAFNGVGQSAEIFADTTLAAATNQYIDKCVHDRAAEDTIAIRW